MTPALLVLTLLIAPVHAGEEQELRNRFSSALIFEAAPKGDEAVALEWVLGDTLRAQLIEREALELQLRVAARAGIRLGEQSGLDRTRVRALGLHLEAGRLSGALGRFNPLGGGYRLVDGAEGLYSVTDSLRVGAWAGLAPDPYSTLPALRYGGGPVLAWETSKAEASLFGEVLATPDGLDRVSGVAQGRVEFGQLAELAGGLDLQSSAEGVRLADARLLLRLDPSEQLRLDVGYDAWSSLYYASSEARDPDITRFAARSAELLGDPWIPQASMDTSVYHQGSARASWRKETPELDMHHVKVGALARYRHHPLDARRYLNTGLTLGAQGLASGRLDAWAGQALVYWGGYWGSETTGGVWVQLDDDGAWALDSSAAAVWTALEGKPGGATGTAGLAPSYYADVFVDWVARRGLSLSLGYSFANSMDLDRWDSYHAGIGRVSWSYDSRRHARQRAARQETD